MRVLFVLVEQFGQVAYDAELVWYQLESALEDIGSVSGSRLEQPTEDRLKSKLAEEPWDIVHLMTEVQEHNGAYSTLALLSSDGHLRRLPSSRFAKLLVGFPSIKMMVLQSAGKNAPLPVNVVQDLLVGQVPGLVSTTLLGSRSEREFVRRLYGGLAEGKGFVELAALLEGVSESPIRLAGGGLAHPFTVVPRSVMPIHDLEASIVKLQENGIAEPERLPIEKKFDVFLCHNSQDKPLVLEIAEELKCAGIVPWLDMWEVGAGYFQEQLEAGIAASKLAIVCMGPHPIDRWQKAELQIIMDAHVAGDLTVIPVWLSIAEPHKRPNISALLRQLNWIDFTRNSPPPMERLIQDIRRVIERKSSR